MPPIQDKHFTKSNVLPLTEFVIFKLSMIAYDIINSITLFGIEFNNAHLSTLFASIDPKIMKLHRLKGRTQEAETALNHFDQRP